MRKEAERWLRQAQADLKAARDSLEDKHYEWSCFQAQQCGEKALKAFLYDKGFTTIISHSLKELLQECVKHESEFAQATRAAKMLDMYYIPTRYPNGLSGSLVPVDFYEKEDAEQCISYAELILTISTKYLTN